MKTLEIPVVISGYYKGGKIIAVLGNHDATVFARYLEQRGIGATIRFIVGRGEIEFEFEKQSDAERIGAWFG